jgi:hypothetical protein
MSSHLRDICYFNVCGFNRYRTTLWHCEALKRNKIYGVIIFSEYFLRISSVKMFCPQGGGSSFVQNTTTQVATWYHNVPPTQKKTSKISLVFKLQNSVPARVYAVLIYMSFNAPALQRSAMFIPSTF